MPPHPAGGGAFRARHRPGAGVSGPQPATAPIGPRMQAMGYSLMASSAEDYASLIRREITTWRGVIATAGVQPE